MSGQEGQGEGDRAGGEGERQGRQARLPRGPVPASRRCRVVQWRLGLDHVGPCSFWNQELQRGAWGPKRDQPVSALQEAAARVLLSLWLTALTSGAPGSWHPVRAPRLSGPLGLGPEEVARVAGVRTGSGAGLGQEQGLRSV